MPCVNPQLQWYSYNFGHSRGQAGSEEASGNVNLSFTEGGGGAGGGVREVLEVATPLLLPSGLRK